MNDRTTYTATRKAKSQALVQLIAAQRSEIKERREVEAAKKRWLKSVEIKPQKPRDRLRAAQRLSELLRVSP